MKVKKSVRFEFLTSILATKKKKKKMIHLGYVFLNIEDGLCMNYSLIIIDKYILLFV